MSGGATERGAATVMAAAAVGVLVLLLGLGLQLGAATLARHRAETAADLAALAAAREAVRGEDLACARAGEVATANGAVLRSCRWSGWTVAVGTTAATRGVPSVIGDAEGRALAGPTVLGGHSDGVSSLTSGDRAPPPSR